MFLIHCRRKNVLFEIKPGISESISMKKLSTSKICDFFQLWQLRSHYNPKALLKS